MENVQADAAIGIHVRVEHLGEEPDQGRLVGILLGELHRQLECPVFEWRIVRSVKVTANSDRLSFECPETESHKEWKTDTGDSQ